MSIEDKARESAEWHYGPEDDQPTRLAKSAYALGYVRGHAEALRFRTVEEERPPLGAYIVVRLPDVDRPHGIELCSTESLIEHLRTEGILWHRL